MLLMAYFNIMHICKLPSVGCLSLAELGRRGLLLPSRLPDGEHFSSALLYPYLTFGVGRLLHLPSAEAVSVRPNAQPRCNQRSQ